MTFPVQNSPWCSSTKTHGTWENITSNVRTLCITRVRWIKMWPKGDGELERCVTHVEGASDTYGHSMHACSQTHTHTHTQQSYTKCLIGVPHSYRIRWTNWDTYTLMCTRVHTHTHAHALSHTACTLWAHLLLPQRHQPTEEARYMWQGPEKKGGGALHSFSQHSACLRCLLQATLPLRNLYLWTAT